MAMVLTDREWDVLDPRVKEFKAARVFRLVVGKDRLGWVLMQVFRDTPESKTGWPSQELFRSAGGAAKDRAAVRRQAALLLLKMRHNCFIKRLNVAKVMPKP